MNLMKTTPIPNPMRLVQTLIVLLFCVFLSACGNQQKYGGSDATKVFNPESWKTISEPTLGFKAKFPGDWKHNVDFMETENGMATVHIFEYWHVAFQYGLTVVKLPAGASDMSDPDKVLDYAIKTLIDENNGVLSYEEPINMSGYPARRAVVLLPDSYLKNARVNTLIILRNSLVYRVTTSGIGNAEYVEHYLNSFELTPVSL